MAIDVKPIVLKKFSPSEKIRLDEIKFWMIINQMRESGSIVAAPMGSTTTHMIASILGVVPPTIDYAFNTINMPASMPTTQDMCIMLKYNKVPARKTHVTPETYYKKIRQYRVAGQPELVPVLSEATITWVRKFMKKYQAAFGGKRNVTIEMLTRG